MTKKYFYPASRAHHAYCMATDFGMEFEKRFGKWEPEGLLHLRGVGEYRIYVHQDSVPLLQPRLDDLVEMKFAEWAENGTETEYLIWQLFDGAEIENLERIIEREGKPFHWPEFEEVPDV